MITCTLDLEDSNLYNSQLDGDSSDVELAFTSGDDSITFLLRNAKIIDYSDDVTSFGRIERTVSFMGIAGTNPAFKITLVNDDEFGTGN